MRPVTIATAALFLCISCTYADSDSIQFELKPTTCASKDKKHCPPPADMSAPAPVVDMAVPPDLAAPLDLSVPLDLSTPADLADPLDFTVIPDLSRTPLYRPGMRVMALGDSYTAAWWIRAALATDLAGDGGVLPEYVGTQQNGTGYLADLDHEGHSGWTLDQLTNGLADGGSVNTWIPATNPELIVIVAGVNELAHVNEVALAPARLAALFDRIHSLVPDVLVIYASHPLSTDAVTQDRIVAFNPQAQAICAARPWCVWSDAGAAVTAALLANPTHPNPDGYRAMEKVIYATIQAGR